jgi:thiol-disulfide isomerase/thioredoxin
MKHAAKLWLVPLVFGPALAQGTDAPAAILRSLLKATEKIDTIEYEVRRDSKGSDGVQHHSRSRVLASRSPLGIRAQFQDEETGVRDLAVLEGDVTRYSAEGIAGEVPRTFVATGQVVPNRSAVDVAMTWRLLLDREYITTAIESGNIVYAGKDDIEGELCRTVMYVRVGEDSGSTIDWFWISNKTGLPRAAQRVTLRRGITRLIDRAVITIVRVNPKIAPETFAYRPTPADSTPEPPYKGHAPRSLSGTRLPDLEVKDADFTSRKLPDLIGTPVLIMFWSPWCAPCVDEMRALVKLEPVYRGKLKVAAIGVQDSRLNILTWWKEHPQFDFMLLTDPELPEANSRLSTYFGAGGIPVNVLVGADGKVIENWFGYEAAELEQKIVRLLRPVEK